MVAIPQPPRIDLPKSWQGYVRSAVLHAIALAQGLPRFIGYYAIVYARARAADSINARVRFAAENDRLHEECALLCEELRLKDSRIAQIAPQRRPHYGPYERIAKVFRYISTSAAAVGVDCFRRTSMSDKRPF